MVENNQENENLMDEFEQLILDVSKEIIDNTVMDDLKTLRVDLKSEMSNFSEQATKINTITNNIDNLLTQTSVNMTEAVKNTTQDLNTFLSETNEILTSKYSKIVEDLDSILAGSADLIETKFGDATAEIRDMLVETTSSIESSIITSKRDIELILEGAKEGFSETTNTIENSINENKKDVEIILNDAKGGFSETAERINHSVSNIHEQLNEVFERHSIKLNQIIQDAERRLEVISNTTSENFTDEIKLLKDYLFNSDKLIKDNQNSIKDIQIRIEERLTEALVAIKDETLKNKFNFDQSLSILDELSTKIGKDIFRLIELNNTINIKEDHIIEHVKKYTKKAKLRFLISTILSSATLVSIVSLFAYLVMKG